MTYDDPQFNVSIAYGPIFGSFSQVIHTTSTKAETSANTTDRHEFFRKIKVTDFKVLPKTGITQGGNAASITYSIRLMAGADIIATAVLKGTEDAGTMVEGVVVSSNASKIDADEALQLVLRITPSSTAHTSTANSVEAFIEYQNRI